MINEGFTILEWDVTGSIVQHDCDFVDDGYFKSLQSRRPDREFVPEKGSPAEAISTAEYTSRINVTVQKVIPLPARALSEIWSSIELNVPGKVIFEGTKMPAQISVDLPRIQYLVLDGERIYSNKIQIEKPCEIILAHLKPLTNSHQELIRLALLITQSSMSSLFMLIDDYFSHRHLGFNCAMHSFSTIYIHISPLTIRCCRLFRIISIEEGNTLGYVKGERSYIINKDDLKSGIVKSSKTFDCISPFFKEQADAIAFSWKKDSATCLVS